MPPWYSDAEQWLLAHGWPALLLGAGIIIGVTFFFVIHRDPILLAGWLTYLFMP